MTWQHALWTMSLLADSCVTMKNCQGMQVSMLLHAMPCSRNNPMCLSRNTLVFVSSGHAPLPSLCNGYRCFQVDDVWRKRGAFFKQHPVRELHALLDYNLALRYDGFTVSRATLWWQQYDLLLHRGESFYGNQHSTFSAHLFMAFARMHRPSRAYNADCKNEEDCRRVPDMYKVCCLQLVGQVSKRYCNLQFNFRFLNVYKHMT